MHAMLAKVSFLFIITNALFLQEKNVETQEVLMFYRTAFLKTFYLAALKGLSVANGNVHTCMLF